MLSPADNELLTRTGPGTPMGDYFRRFWLPLQDEIGIPVVEPTQAAVSMAIGRVRLNWTGS